MSLLMHRRDSAGYSTTEKGVLPFFLLGLPIRVYLKDIVAWGPVWHHTVSVE